MIITNRISITSTNESSMDFSPTMPQADAKNPPKEINILITKSLAITGNKVKNIETEAKL